MSRAMKIIMLAFTSVAIISTATSSYGQVKVRSFIKGKGYTAPCVSYQPALIPNCGFETSKNLDYQQFAKRGCCSWHRGVCGCNAWGQIECCDGTISPSCTCHHKAAPNQLSLQNDSNSNGIVFAQGYHYVRPHVRKNGTYVPGHYRTNPDGNRFNNWSTKGNVNPFTGRKGYQNPYPSIYKSTPSRRSNSIYDSYR